jgi:hypothetical protein
MPSLTLPKRRGCPPGGWPSQKAKRAPNKPTASLKEPLGNVQYVFGIEHEGKALYAVFMYTLQNGAILTKHKLADGEFAKNAVRRMAQSAIQIELNHMDPKRLSRFEVMPSISGQMR